MEIKLNPGYMRFTFSDEDGDVFSTFKLNPTDPHLITRCKNLSDAFSAISGIPRSADDLVKRDETVENLFCEFLGYDCRKSLFGRVSATAEMADGRIFAFHVLDTVINHVGPEIQKRRRERIEKHTAQYTK